MLCSPGRPQTYNPAFTNVLSIHFVLFAQHAKTCVVNSRARATAAWNSGFQLKVSQGYCGTSQLEAGQDHCCVLEEPQTLPPCQGETDQQVVLKTVDGCCTWLPANTTGNPQQARRAVTSPISQKGSVSAMPQPWSFILTRAQVWSLAHLCKDKDAPGTRQRNRIAFANDVE